MKTVRILGNASNLSLMPRSLEIETEVWCCNQKRGYMKFLPRVIFEGEWTRWFNLHSQDHMVDTYPRDYYWLTQQTKPIYCQKVFPAIPSSQRFPREEIQAFFSSPDKSFRYFTCTGAWLIALAIMEGFNKIELWGFEIKRRKPTFAWERPCMFYWIQEARRRGLEVYYPTQGTEDWNLNETGDPMNYDGPLYGYSTKPEVGWNATTESFD